MLLLRDQRRVAQIRAHRAGTVAKIHVTKGATVEARSPLVTLAGTA